jgi:hypothetical protein
MNERREEREPGLARLLYAADVARLMGWGDDRSAVQRARRWMRRNGLVDRDGRRYVTTRARLREAFPAAYLDAIEELSK